MHLHHVVAVCGDLNLQKKKSQGGRDVKCGSQRGSRTALLLKFEEAEEASAKKGKKKKKTFLSRKDRGTVGQKKT